MLEKILEKLGVESAEQFWDNEDKKIEKYNGSGIEYRSKLFSLTREESLFFRNYCKENNLF